MTVTRMPDTGTGGAAPFEALIMGLLSLAAGTAATLRRRIV